MNRCKNNAMNVVTSCRACDLLFEVQFNFRLFKIR